jgi:hypothetical protein
LTKVFIFHQNFTRAILITFEAAIIGICVKLFFVSSGKRFQSKKSKILEIIYDDFHFYFDLKLRKKVKNDFNLKICQNNLHFFLI